MNRLGELAVVKLTAADDEQREQAREPGFLRGVRFERAIALAKRRRTSQKSITANGAKARTNRMPTRVRSFI